MVLVSSSAGSAAGSAATLASALVAVSGRGGIYETGLYGRVGVCVWSNGEDGVVVVVVVRANTFARLHWTV